MCNVQHKFTKLINILQNLIHITYLTYQTNNINDEIKAKTYLNTLMIKVTSKIYYSLNSSFLKIQNHNKRLPLKEFKTPKKLVLSTSFFFLFKFASLYTSALVDWNKNKSMPQCNWLILSTWLFACNKKDHIAHLSNNKNVWLSLVYLLQSI